MQDSKLIHLLKSLHANELKRFVEYVQSPYYNKHEKLISFVLFLQKKAPAYLIDKVGVFKQLFPKEKYVEQKVNDIMSYTVGLLEDFIAEEHFSKQITLKKYYLLAELRERKLNKLFQSAAREQSKLLENQPFRNQDFYQYNYLLESESDLFFITNESRKNDDSLQRKCDNLDFYYLSLKLKNFCEMINRQNIVSSSYNLRMLEEIKKHVSDNLLDYEAFPAITIYYQILLTLTESENTEHFKTLKELLNKHYLLFPKEEVQQMYNYAQNYCIKKINSGSRLFLNELFELYKILLANKVIFEGKYLSQWDYKNIVTISLRLNEFRWTEEFLSNYKKEIAPENQENAYAYNMASLYYSTKEYKNALKLLQAVEFTDVFYHLGSKSMLLKMYYELDDTEAFYSLLDAFKMYLNRNKSISKYQFTVHMNLIKFAKRAYNLRISGNKKAIEKLKQQIVQNIQITNLQWLQEQVNLL